MKLNKDKSVVVDKNITYYLNPDYIYIPISNKNYLVKQNSKVYKNMDVGVNMLSSVSGKAYGIKRCNVMGKSTTTIVVQNDFREYTKIDTHKIKLTIPNLINNINNKKLLDKIKSNKLFNNIVLNVIDDNPYIYNSIYLLQEHTKELIDLLNKLSILYKCSNVFIVIKNEEVTIVDELLDLIGAYPSIKVVLVNDEYMLDINNKLNLNGTTLNLNMEELTIINDLLNGSTNTTKLITISGDAIKGKVLRVKKYTLLKDIIDKYIEVTHDNYVVYVNGLMNGFLVKDISDFVISDDVKYINIMKNIKYKEGKCIKCGKCISVCPVHVDILNKKNIDKCINCGLCNYICPVHINLRSNNDISKNK